MLGLVPSCWPSSSQPLLACGQPPSSPLDPPEEGFRARHLISTSTIVVLHYTGSNILKTGQRNPTSLHWNQDQDQRRQTEKLPRVFTSVGALVRRHMRAYARTYEAARTYKYTLAKSIPSVAKVVRYPPGENGFYLNVMYKHYYYHNYYYWFNIIFITLCV